MTDIETGTISAFLSQSITIVKDAMVGVWGLMVANDLLTLFVGASILSLGFAFFRKAKRAVR